MNNEQKNEVRGQREFAQLMFKCGAAVQKYIAHILDKKVTDLWEDEFEPVPAMYRNADNDETHALFIDLVQRNHNFNLSKFDKKMIREEMANMINAARTMIYPTMLSQIKEDADITDDERKQLGRSQLIVDPTNTTMTILDKEDMEWSKKIRDTKKRIGFHW
jgi:hypothetical protein